MSTKKRFSISADLANGLRSSIQSASSNHGQLQYDMMSVEVIEPDPNNPRKLSVTFEDLKNGSESFQKNEIKANEIAALKELAESIKRVGIRNAIEVYKEGAKYRIISGERRFLAAILADQKFVPVRISQKMDEFKLRYTQWVENINRQDLSLWEKYNNLVSISDSYTKANKVDLDAKVLRELLGVSDVQSYRYYCLLNADKDIIDLVKQGKLTNVKVVQELASVKNKNSRDEMLKSIRLSNNDITSLALFKNMQQKSGQRKYSITLNNLNNPSLAKYIFNLLLKNSHLDVTHSKFAHINWSSARSANKAFKDLLSTIEQKLLIEEPADEINS